MFVMKHHTPLRAASCIQAHSKHLKVYAKIELLERGKQPNAEDYCSLLTRWRRRTISAFSGCESGGTVPMKFWKHDGGIATSRK